MHIYKLLYIFVGLLVLFNIFAWKAVATESSLDSPELYFFDVGQGDSSLIRTSENKKILVDAGKPNGLALKELTRILRGDRYIDLLVMSHPQLDHYGGFIEVLKTFKVGALIGPGTVSSEGAYSELMSMLNKKNIPYIRVTEGDSIKLGVAEIKILSPSTQELLSEDANDHSLVMLVELEGFNALYTGDASKEIEEKVMKKHAPRASILKVGHHGSRTSSGEKFIQRLAPAAAVVSLGKNDFGHPHKEVLDTLYSFTNVFRTDEDGTIRTTWNAGELLVEKAL